MIRSRRRAPFATGALLLAFASVIAGCSDPGARPRSVPIEIPEAYGTVAGSVVDEEIIPVAGARLELKPLGFWTLSGADGRFGFDYVPTGHHTIEATLAGATASDEFDLSDGDTAELQVQLILPKVGRPYKLVQVEKGHFGCHAAAQTCPGYGSPNERTRFDVAWEPGLAAVLAEIVWDPKVALPCAPLVLPIPNGQIGHSPCLSDLHAWMWYKSESVPRMQNGGGPPYLRLELAATNLLKVDGPGLRVDVLTEFFGINHYNPGVAVEQPFDVYLTTFYLLDRMEGYTAVPT